MGTAIVVGGIPLKQWLVPIEKFIGDAGRARASETVEGWAVDREETLVDTLNEASVVLFLEYTARLESLGNSDGTGAGSRWKNLPYWLAAVWLPLNGNGIEPIVDEAAGEPVMISTATGLIRDLKDIAGMSGIPFGKQPRLFDIMIGNPQTFYKRTADLTLSEEETIQWVWYAYHWSAQKALSTSLVAWQGG